MGPGRRDVRTEGEGLGTTLAKLFAHGILFAAVTTVFSFLIALGLFGFMVVGLVLGGLVGFLLALLALVVVLAAAYGYANAGITRFLWFPVRRGLSAYLGQGFLLFFLLIFAESIPVFLITLAIVGLTGNPALAVPGQIIATVLLAVVTGFVGRWVAGLWREGPRARAASAPMGASNPSLLLRPNNPEGLYCPNCGRQRLIIAADRSAFCIDCQKGIYSM